jgi:tripartite motif-containing protein 71
VSNYNSSRVEKLTVSTGVWSWFGGTAGTGNGQFSTPSQIAFDSTGNVYVSDRGNYRFQKFNSSGGYLAQWGSNGTGDGQFISPDGIAVDSSNNVYVGDQGTHRIQKFTSSGTLLGWWGLDNIGSTGWHAPGSGRTGVSGSLDGQLYRPGNLAVHSSGNIYVGDSSNNRLQEFTSGGIFSAKFGTAGAGNGQFSNPFGIAINNSTGYIYIADEANHRIQIIRRVG